MVPAKRQDKDTIIQLLTEAFDKNQSVGYIVKSGPDRKKRLRYLMAYSFELCYRYGEVYVTEDRTACALLAYPRKKKGFTLMPLWLDVMLIFKTIGISGIKKALARESAIKANYPRTPFLYLWFIGVDVRHQGKGIGSALLSEVMEVARRGNLPVYLETSTLKNLPWYKRFGFSVFKEIFPGYRLFMLKSPDPERG